MSENKTDKDLLRPHTVDGIQEYDNALPTWWVWLFILCVIFAGVYWVYVEVLDKGTIIQEYTSDVETREKAAEVASAKAAKEAEKSGGLAALVKDPEMIAQGGVQFGLFCATCHGQKGEGGTGPNLTDKFWIHGGSPEIIKKTIAEGILAKGMPAWKAVLGNKKVDMVVAHVISLQGTNPPNAKAPQGEEYDGQP